MIERHYASVVIRDGQDRFLTMLHSKKAEHPWRFPGGKVDDRELPIAAAARELYEELGIVAEDLKLVSIHRTEVDGGVWVGHFYLLGDYSGVIEIVEPDKHIEWRYLTAHELLEFNSRPETDVVIDLLLKR